MVNLITFKLPYYCIYGMTRVCSEKQHKVWNKLPFRNLKSPSILPDENIIICSLEDHFYEWEVYHNSPYDRIFKPKKGDIVVDVGAHIGFYTLRAAKMLAIVGML